MAAAAALLTLLGLSLPAGARGSHTQTELVSTGPIGGDAGCTCEARISTDGSRVAFSTYETLVPEDGSNLSVYLRAAGATTLLSGNATASLGEASDDVQHILIYTNGALTPQDTDAGAADYYDWHDGAPELVSIGPTGGTASVAPSFGRISGEGSRITFATSEQLVTSDLDSNVDLYERQGGQTTLLSTGSIGGNGSFDASFEGNTPDASHVFFRTSEALDPADLDATPDLYAHSGGVTSLVSTGPTAGPGTTRGPSFEAASPDGGHVLFSTQEQLVAADADGGLTDIYERSGGVTTLVSTGPADANLSFACGRATVEGPICQQHTRISDDGSRAFFVTGEGLVSGDSDGRLDLYERSGGTTTLLSTGPAGGNGPYPIPRAPFQGFSVLVSKNGDRAFFVTAEALVAEDLDGARQDVYERSSGTTKLVSTGADMNSVYAAYLDATSDNGGRVFFSLAGGVYERFAGITTPIETGISSAPSGLITGGLTPSGEHVLIHTYDPLLPVDTDTSSDIYKRSVAAPYDAPGAAASLHFSLVPHLRQTISATQCQARGGLNSTHGGPLSLSSCSPPRLLPGTVAHFGPGSTGFGRLTAIAGDTSLPNGDQADVAIEMAADDIRTAAGADYDPSATGPDGTFTIALRLSDTFNGPSQTDPATVEDFDLSVAIDCAASADPGVGADCSFGTTADSLTPGMVREGETTVLQTFGARLYDAGVDGTLGNVDDRWFAMAGVYIP